MPLVSNVSLSVPNETNAGIYLPEIANDGILTGDSRTC